MKAPALGKPRIKSLHTAQEDRESARETGTEKARERGKEEKKELGRLLPVALPPSVFPIPSWDDN